MKRYLAIAIAVFLLFSLAACGEEEAQVPSGSGQKLGLGNVSTVAMDGDDKTVIKSTAAAVLLDKDGKILSCELDEVEVAFTLRDGVLQQPVPMLSKREQEDDRWEEQVDAFCDYVAGKTGMEVSGIAATDGKSTQIPGCDLVITDFIQAVRRAADTALAKNAAAKDELHFAMTVEKSYDSSETKPKFSVEMAAVTLDDSDRITACVTDTAEAKLAIADMAFTHDTGKLASKRDAGNSYGMKNASGIKKEWYEQANAFDAYAVGKTAATLGATKIGAGGKTDAISGCTIAVSGMLKNALKAARD